MLRHRPTTTIAERVTILERASAGETDSMIAASLGCSIWTIRKWRRRGQHQGRAGLTPHRGRPTTGFLSTVPQPLRDAILPSAAHILAGGQPPSWPNCVPTLPGMTIRSRAVHGLPRCSNTPS